MRSDRRKYVGLLIVVLLAACVWIIATFRNVEMEPYATYKSPDDKYTLAVYGKKARGLLPGQGGDVPGVVILRNDKGAVLRKQDVEMVQLVEKPEWSDKGVSVKLLFEWKY